jgi:hypothetical protein
MQHAQQARHYIWIDIAESDEVDQHIMKYSSETPELFIIPKARRAQHCVSQVRHIHSSFM